jgi:hypothetical protein
MPSGDEEEIVERDELLLFELLLFVFLRPSRRGLSWWAPICVHLVSQTKARADEPCRRASSIAHVGHKRPTTSLQSCNWVEKQRHSSGDRT